MLVQEEVTNQISLGNCKDILQKLPQNSVQLTITSPHIEMQSIMISMHQEAVLTIVGNKRDTNDYLNDMTDIFGEKVYHVTKEGGYCCIVIANEVVNGTILPLPHIAVPACPTFWEMESS